MIDHLLNYSWYIATVCLIIPQFWFLNWTNKYARYFYINCLIRGFFPRVDVSRTCFFGGFISSVFVGRALATVGELSLVICVQNYIKQKLKFNFFEFWALNISALIFLIAPLVISYNLNSSVNTYKQSTVKIFEQLNPNFKRLVNARAQIDDLTRNIPQQNNISKQDFGVLNYLDAFKDDSIQRIAINLKEQEINIRLEGLPPLKLNLLKQMLKLEELNFIESDLIEKDEGFFGNLLVQYET